MHLLINAVWVYYEITPYSRYGNMYVKLLKYDVKKKEMVRTSSFFQNIYQSNEMQYVASNCILLNTIIIFFFKEI